MYITYMHIYAYTANHMNHQVAAAHSCLSDPEKRKDYDRKLAAGDANGRDFGGFGFFMFDVYGMRCNCRWC